MMMMTIVSLKVKAMSSVSQCQRCPNVTRLVLRIAVVSLAVKAVLVIPHVDHDLAWIILWIWFNKGFYVIIYCPYLEPVL